MLSSVLAGALDECGLEFLFEGVNGHNNVRVPEPHACHTVPGVYTRGHVALPHPTVQAPAVRLFGLIRKPYKRFGSTQNSYPKQK